MEYGLTKRGRAADVKPTPAGKVLEYMKDGHGIINPEEANYELQLSNSKQILDELVKAGYVWKEETSGRGLL